MTIDRENMTAFDETDFGLNNGLTCLIFQTECKKKISFCMFNMLVIWYVFLCPFGTDLLKVPKRPKVILG